MPTKTDTNDAGPSEQLKQIPLDQLFPSHDNPRRKVGDLKELTASIETHGIVEPIIAIPLDDGGYQIVAGHRRHAAAQKAGLATAPVVVRDVMSDQDRGQLMLIENLQRADLAAIEEAVAFQRLVAYGMKPKEIGPKIGRSSSLVRDRLALLKLPEVAQDALDAGDITVGEAGQLTRLAGHDDLITEILADRDETRRWGSSIEDEVAKALRVIETAKRRDKEVAASARLATFPVVAGQGSPHSLAWDHPPKGTRAIVEHGKTTMGVSLKVHEKQDCHAIAVLLRGDDVVEEPVCTKPANHKPKEVKETPGSKTKAAKEEAARKESAAARDRHDEDLDADKVRREAFITKLLKPAAAPADAGDLMAHCVLVMPEPYSERAREYLGIPKPTSWWNADQWVTKHPKQLTKVALACAIAGLESWLFGDMPGNTPTAIAYLKWLERHGYEISPAERLEMDGKAP